MSVDEFLCPDCGKPMNLAPSIDYYCLTPSCVEKIRRRFEETIREGRKARERLRDAAPDLAEALKPFDKWLSTMPDHLAFDDPEKIIAGEGDYAIRAKHLRASRLALSRATGGDNG